MRIVRSCSNLKCLVAVAALALLLAGCSRQDTECLAQIGRKVLEHTQANNEALQALIDPNLKGLAPVPSVRERVQERLRWDRELADVKIEVRVKDNTVELKGTLPTEAQRRRAVELAETTAGVQQVADQLQVGKAE